MSFCEGENLESIICNSKTREQGVELLREEDMDISDIKILIRKFLKTIYQ